MEAKPYRLFDPGVQILEAMFRLLGIEADPEEIRRHAGRGAMDVAALQRCTAHYGLHARVLRTDWGRLGACALPAIALLRGGGFLLLGKTERDKAIVLMPHATRPSIVTRTEFEAQWDGGLVLIKKRSLLAAWALRLGGTLGALAASGREIDFIKWRGVLAAWALRLAGTLRALSRSGRQVDGIGPTDPAQSPGIAAQPGRGLAGSTVIDFAERARRLRHVVGLERPDDSRPRADELAFLPAALEIAETPPSPVGRAIMFTVIAIFVVALVWACIGTVDIVAVAPGKVVPSGGTKTIQPFETGVVRAIRVRDGQQVKAGDVLIELDPTMNSAELGHIRGDLAAARLDIARLRAALSGNPDPLAAFVPPADVPVEAIEMHRRFLRSQTSEQNAKLAAIDRQVAQKEAERATIQASIEKLRATLAPLQERVDIRQQLVQKELASRITYLSELQELVSQKQEILVQQSRYTEADAAVASLQETRSKTIAEYQRGLFDELAKAEQKAAGLGQDVVKAGQRTSLQTLTAPVDGMVQQISVHTIGGVVTPAQTLMLVVPANSQIEIEAMVSNRDIGFIEAGQDVALKIDTFNFTRYGMLHGKVLTVSRDAITRDKPQGRTGDKASGGEADSSEPNGQELSYAARISVDQPDMEVEDRRVSLTPGMAITAEIKTGSRRIIGYLLSPLMRYKHESLRER